MNWKLKSFLPACVVVLLLFLPTRFSPDALAQEKNNAAVKKPIKLIVIVPKSAFDARTKLWLFDSLSSTTGTRREITTIPLDPGKKYYYDLKMQFEPNNYTKITRRYRIQGMVPGRTYTVDMTKKNPKVPDDIKVRWVPTPKAVVDKMLKLAKAGKEDVVYDLGCGDGVIVITAVKEFGVKRGVGVDIDPKKLADAKAAAKQAGVADRVSFREGDVLKKLDDVQQATIVALYMGLDINLRLKPILRSRLKPGSRVVSHRFLMGDDWPPDKTITHTDSKGRRFLIHMWTIRAGDKKAGPKEAPRPKKRGNAKS